jgi:TctA family transporter
MLSAAFNIVGFSWITSPAATELEVIVLDWFAKMLKLPSQFLSSGKAAIIFLGLIHKQSLDHNIYFLQFGSLYQAPHNSVASLDNYD